MAVISPFSHKIVINTKYSVIISPKFYLLSNNWSCLRHHASGPGLLFLSFFIFAGVSVYCHLSRVNNPRKGFPCPPNLDKIPEKIGGRTPSGHPAPKMPAIRLVHRTRRYRHIRPPPDSRIAYRRRQKIGGGHRNFLVKTA